MNVQYKWFLTINSTTTEVNPIYKDDLSIDYQQESGQKFFRGKLSGKIQFVGDEATMIINAPFYTEFILAVKRKTQVETTWSNYYSCHFYKTDCTINEDDLNVSVQPSVTDRYNDILNGWEKEYDLLENALAIQPIKAKKRPMWQIYVEGDSIVSCLSCANSFETDRINEDRTPQSCHFGKFNEQWKLYFNGNIDGLIEPFIGVFSGLDQRPYQYKDKFYNIENIYYVEYFCYSEQDVSEVYFTNGLRVKRINNDEVVYEFTQTFTDTQGGFGIIPDSITFQPIDTSLTDIVATKQKINVYGRIVCDVERIEMIPDTFVNTYAISSNDIVNNNRNYRYCLEWDTLNVKQSNRLSDTPTKWGRADGGKYFLPPDDTTPWLPIGQSTWVNTSIWVESVNSSYYDTKASKEYTIKDAYPLASVINALLSKIAPTVIFDEVAGNSQFFYDDYVASGVGSVFNGSRPFITPKSNTLLGEYQEPARKAPITLKAVFDMLAKVYGCYWCIDDDNNLVIEHTEWFKNGGSYSSSPSVGYDLTRLQNEPNEKKWAFGTSTYQFDKMEMASRYQYEWMDEVSDLFKGRPIGILSAFVQQNKVEEVSIANFSSDIDLMLLAPEKFSKDGFALLQANAVTGGYELPMYTYNEGVAEYRLQNYKVSMKFLQPNCLIFDMPSWSISLDGVATTAGDIQHLKKQTISFPVGEYDPNTLSLVRTYLGYGQFDKVSVNLSSRTGKATIKYKTYDN